MTIYATTPIFLIHFQPDSRTNTSTHISYITVLKGTILSYTGCIGLIKAWGTTNNVNDVLNQGDIFVFPSAYEGFGLTLAEAMSIGLPGIGYKNCSAVNELIQDGVNGLLADDGVDSLAEKMQQLMGNQEMRARFGKAAHEAMKQYDSAIIWDEWEKLIAEVATCN